jgi:PAS domain S-box-containing protein
MDRWPKSLRGLVDMLLAHPLPMIVLWGPDLIQIYNDGFAEIAGGKHPAGMGMPTFDCWPEARPITEPIYRRVLAGEAVRLEDQLFRLTRNGPLEDVYLTVSYGPVRDDAGEIAGVFASLFETTAQVGAQREREHLLTALRSERSVLAEVFRRSPAFIAVMRGPSHVVELVNEQYYRLVGQREMVGLSIRDALPEIEGQGYFELLDRVYATGEAFVGRGVRAHLQREPGQRREEVIIDLVYQPLRDAAGNVTGIFAHGVDLSDHKRAEEALRESEQRLRALIEQTSAGIANLALDGRFLFANQRFCEICGYTQEELLARRMQDITYTPDVAPNEQLIARAMATGHEYELEKRYVRKDGSLVWVGVTSKVLRGPGGAPQSILGVVLDISDRKRVEEALGRTTERLELAQRAGHIGVFDWDVPTGRVVWSAEEERLFGLPPGTFEGTIAGWERRIVPEDLARITAEMEAAMRDGRPGVDLAFRILRADGAVRSVEGSARLVYDPDGRPRRMVGVNIDVTERLQAQAAATEAQRRYRAVFEATRDAMIIYTADGTIAEVNPAASGMYGYAPRELAGVRARDAIHPDARPHFDEFLRVAGAGGTYRCETVDRRRDGTEFPIEVTGTSFEFNGRRHLMAVIRDITDRKAAEAALLAAKDEAERASRAKDEFLAVLSHELRTPLTPVLLTVSVLETHPALPAELRADVATIKNNVELESRLIGDLLDLTRVAKGKLQLEVEDVDLHAAIRAAVAVCERTPSAALTVDLRAARHAVRGDATRLQQIVWNLVSNAQKFTPADGEIVVRTYDVPAEAGRGDEAGRVRVEVRDTGEGIDPAVLPRLFAAFEQGEGRTGRQLAGLGLGLAISRKLAEAHGGTITAASAGRGKGATFTVELPAMAGPARPAARPAAAPAVIRPLSILLVEDHEPTRRVMAKLLGGQGHRVTAAGTVAAAVRAAGGGAFDLLISDLGLPDGSGLDVVRALGPRLAGRAIALTGYGMDRDVAATEAAGFAAHLTKPVDVETLTATIARVIGGGR